MEFPSLFTHRIRDEADRWCSKGIISSDQRDGILALYGIGAQEAGGNSMGVRVLSAIAAILMGLAVLLMVGRNWEEIPAVLRVVALCSGTFTLIGGGVWFDTKGRSTLGQFLLFLGALVYGATLFLIAQIYHLNTSEPMLLLGWAAGVVPLAYATGRNRFVLLGQAILVPYIFWDTWLLGEGNGVAALSWYAPFGVALWILALRASSRIPTLIQFLCTGVVLNWLLYDLYPDLMKDGHFFSYHMLLTSVYAATLFFLGGRLQATLPSTLSQNCGYLHRLSFRYAFVVLLAVSGPLSRLIYYWGTQAGSLQHHSLSALPVTIFMSLVIIGLTIVGVLICSSSLSSLRIKGPLTGKLLSITQSTYRAVIVCGAVLIFIPYAFDEVYILVEFLDPRRPYFLGTYSNLLLLFSAIGMIIEGHRLHRNRRIVFAGFIISLLGLFGYANLGFGFGYVTTAVILMLEGSFLLGLAWLLKGRVNQKEVV